MAHNHTITVKDRVLVITVPLSDSAVNNAPLSSSEKTHSVASSGGFVSSGYTLPDGRQVSVSFNVNIPNLSRTA